MNKKKICCIFNYGSHYRASIYKLMDQEFKCDFYIGDKLPGSIKKMDYNSLIGFKKKLKNIILFGNFYWQVGAIKAVLKPYKHIIMDGEPYCISNWIILILAKLLGKKTYPWTHAWYGRETKTKKIVKKYFFGMAHHILLYGDYARDLMIKEKFPPKKLSCIYNSLDYDTQLSIRKELITTTIFSEYFKNNNPNLIFVGRLTTVKRIDLLIKAIALLKTKPKIYNLIIIGDGEKKEELIKLADEHHLLKNIWFYGSCYNEEKLSELIYNSDLCVSPGNIGLTAMHVMSFGTPALTHNNFPFQVPEFEAIINEKTGLFFEYENYFSLAEKIEFWFSLKIDRNLIRNNCYEIIDTKYNPHFQIRVLKNVLLNNFNL